MRGFMGWRDGRRAGGFGNGRRRAGGAPGCAWPNRPGMPMEQPAVAVPEAAGVRLHETSGDSRPMQIAVASGKGGTGKTLVSTTLTHLLAQYAHVQYVDCDVEEPNGHLFLHPEIGASRAVTTPVPFVDEALCAHCGRCSELCAFHAIASFGRRTVVFPELCHGCGGCAPVCPAGAITWRDREIGVVEAGAAGPAAFLQGRLSVGERMSPPVIRAARAQSDPRAVRILDAPPGTTCSVVTTLRGCDLVLLVTEPTPFGLNDLRLAVEMTRALGLPTAVVVNRDGLGDDAVGRYCAAAAVPIWLRLPYDMRVAQAASCGDLAATVVPEFGALFEPLVRRLQELSGAAPARSSSPGER